MKYPLLIAFAFLAIACSSTKHLEMSPDTDLSALPSHAQCWLVDFENVCISLSENEDFSDTKTLESDIKRAAILLKDLSNEESSKNWYGALSESQTDRLHELMLAIVVHYGVMHFVDM